VLDIHLKDTPYLRVVLVWVLAFVCLIGNAQSLGGFVRDAEGKGLPQANIRIAGTRIGASCNNHGHYHLESVPSGNITVIASYLGYKSDTLSILIAETGRITLDFVLVFDAMWISEMEVIARSSRAEEMLQLPVRTHILEKADIMQSPASSSPALLSSLPGIVVNSDFGLFSSANVSIRGVGGNSQKGTLVVMDGMPLNKADGGSVNWNIIDKDNIETIEIVKGPGSALYGSNAMGGVINIVSRPPAGKFKLNLSSSYGTYNTFEFKAQATGSLKGSGMYYKAFAQYRNSDGYINTPDEIIKENDSIVVPVFVDELFAGGLLGFNLKKHGRIEASYNYFRDVRGRGTKIYEELGSSISRDTQQGFVKYRGRFARWSTYAIAYGLKEKYFRLNEYFSDGEYKLYEVDSDRNDLGFRMLARRDIKKRGNLVLGAEARNGSVNARDVYYTSTDIISNKGEMDILAAFIQYRQISKRSRLTLVAGLRLDFARLNEASFGIEFPSYSVEYFTDFGFKDVKAKYWNAINPKLNLEYAFKRGSNVYLSLAKGFRAPILDDMCRSERSRMGLRIANPELRPEHIYSAETGFLHKFPKNVQLEMSVFFFQRLRFYVSALQRRFGEFGLYPGTGLQNI
jgi:outer membrane receptor protein involved in Fe transport